MSEWISVKERLPKESGRYLVYEARGFHMHNCLAYSYPYPCCEPNIAYYKEYTDGWQWHTGESDLPKPTHWQPLPKSPDQNP